jgi:prevent-host-death family protein
MSVDKEQHYNIHEAKREFSKLIRKVEQGEDIVIDRRNKPVARLSSVSDVTDERPIGTAEDFVNDIGSGFNEPLPDDVLSEFYR